MSNPMSYSDAANILEAHNAWRRGQNDDTDSPPKWKPEETQVLGIAIDVAVDGLRKLGKETKWIACNERLPDFDGIVIVYDSDHGATLADFSIMDGWLSDVTHWMPLPSDPRK